MMIDFSNSNPLVKKIAGFVLLIIGLAFFVLLVRNTINDFPIWFFGRSAAGVVEEKWYELIEQDNSNEFAADYFVRYRFTTPDGEVLSGSTQMAAQEWSAYVEGAEILIVYSPINPANNRVDDSRFIPLLLCAYIPFIFVIWFCLKTGWNILSEQFKKIEPEPWFVENKTN
jgi:hypothetical protein